MRMVSDVRVPHVRGAAGATELLSHMPLLGSRSINAVLVLENVLLEGTSRLQQLFFERVLGF